MFELQSKPAAVGNAAGGESHIISRAALHASMTAVFTTWVVLNLSKHA